MKSQKKCVLFKDIGKTAKDILSDDYDFSNKLKIKTKTANGVTFTTEGTMGGVGNKTILAKISGAFNHSSGINISKLQCTTHGRVVGEANLNNTLLQGLKLNVKCEDGSLKNSAGVKYKPTGKVGADYVHQRFSTSGVIDFANNSFATSAAVKYDNVILGALVNVNVEKSAVADRNLVIGYAGADFNATLLASHQLSKITASFDHTVPTVGNVTYSAVLDHDVKSRKNGLTIGGRYKPDDETTFCGKVNSEGYVSLALVQKLKPKVSLTTSAHLDAKNIEGEAHKFGFGLTLG